jgi:diguanylate cyclase (GGDEF)-like protein/PAS domain S-box-containing protein
LLLGVIAFVSSLALACLVAWYLLRLRRHLNVQERALSRLSDLASQVPGVMFQYLERPDGSACFPFANGCVGQLIQIESGDLSLNAAKAFELIHPDDLPLVRAAIDESARTLSLFEQEFRICREDGTVLWQKARATPQRQVDGAVLWNGFISDSTEGKDRAESLITLSTAVEQSPVSIMIVGLDGDIIYVNPKFERVTGYTQAQVIGCNPRILSGGKKSQQAYSEMWATLLAGRTWIGEFHNRKKDGSLFWERATITRVVDERGMPMHYLAIKEDITDRKLADAQLRIAATAFESQEGMFISDAAGVIVRVNQAFTKITGYSSDEAIGQTPGFLSSGRHDPAFYAAMWASIGASGAWQGEIWNRRKSGEVFPEWLTITAVKDERGNIANYVSTLTDITQRKAAEDRIKHLAFYDPLTGLPNRRLLIDRLLQAIVSSTRTGREGALLFIDLDNFKTLNDTHGHGRGDILLQQVGERLVACAREGDTVARLGGDEFVIMLEDLSQRVSEAAAQAEILGGKILYALNLPFDLVGNEYHITPSIGVTLFSDHHNSADELMKRADLAMYQAKAAGRNTLRFFDPQMQEAVNARVALVRWQHPVLGVVPPDQFIPLAEDAGLILPLGNWVLKTACLQLKAWAANAQTQHLTLSVNVSALQFHTEGFVTEVLSTIKAAEAPASRLKLELTESLLVSDVDDIIVKMHALKSCGVGFSLDDFGTGYSSLNYLKRLPLDQLKIDQSFLHEALINLNDAAIVSAIVTLGHSLGMMVIAEGVETQEQRDFLIERGCNHFQGYFFGRPDSADALQKFFDR